MKVAMMVLATGCAGGPASAPDDGRPAGEARVLVGGAEQSVHELITCGGAMSQFTSTLAVAVASANGELVDPALWDELEPLAEGFGVDLTPEVVRDGPRWRFDMEVGTFDVAFVDPATGASIDGDVRSLDSYVLGVVASSDRTLEQMLAHPEIPATFTYTWTEEGPLAHLLDPLTNPIVVRAAPFDLAFFSLGGRDDEGIDLGSFASLGDLGVVGTVSLVDEQGGATLAYDASLVADTVRELVESGRASIEVEAMSGALEDWTLSTRGVDLDYVPYGLAGEIDYVVVGPDGDEVTATGDYGDGSSYGDVTWGR